jgi:hypothetical protein
MEQLAMEQARARVETAAAAERAKKLAQQTYATAAAAAARAEGDTPEGLYANPPALEGSALQTAKPVSVDEMSQRQKPPL